MREITVFSTKTNRSQVIESDATVWGDLKSSLGALLNEEMVATVMPGKYQLVHKEAALPEGNFQLILTPAKTKSGGEIDLTAVLVKVKSEIQKAISEFEASCNEAVADITEDVAAGFYNKTASSASEDRLRRQADELLKGL